MNSDTRKLLEAVQQGAMSVDEALLAIKKEPFADIGYAKVDMHRKTSSVFPVRRVEKLLEELRVKYRDKKVE